jgi:hypothetical protein
MQALSAQGIHRVGIIRSGNLKPFHLKNSILVVVPMA